MFGLGIKDGINVTDKTDIDNVRYGSKHKSFQRQIEEAINALSIEKNENNKAFAWFMGE